MSTAHPRRTVDDPHLAHSVREAERAFGVEVEIDARAESIHKFGHNAAVVQTATGFTLWSSGTDIAHETYVADGVNSIDSISSGAVGDTQIITVVGHTSIVDNHGVTKRVSVTQNVTLTGTTRAPLATPLNRVERAFNIGATNLAGIVYVYENGALTAGKPQTVADIHLEIASGNQSSKCALSVDSSELLIITDLQLGVLTKQAAVAAVALEVRELGSVFRTRMIFAVDQGGIEYDFVPYLLIGADTDVRLTAISSSASATDVAGTIFGYFANIV
jgi:hypothetical protein